MPACTLAAWVPAESWFLWLRRHSALWFSPGANQSSLRQWIACFRMNITLPDSMISNGCGLHLKVVHALDISYLNPVHGNPDVLEKWLCSCVVLINLCLDSCGVLKGCFHRTVRWKKPHAFLSYKIGQLLPNFPSRTNLGFLFTDYVFGKRQCKKQSQGSFISYL